MCGICGVINLKEKKPVDKEIIGNMLEKIKHRGPDGSDVYVDEECGLGFNRLSFIDLTGGMQPISNEDGSIVMVCNGEIFNFKEIRDELTAKGHKFKTGTDVEVCIHLYEEEGDDFVTKLNGQFAICLYDKKNKRYLLARDHVGICPLFYTEFDGRVIFASEIKAILEYPAMPRKLNLKAVDQLLNFPGVVSPNTFFKDIWSVKPGHMIVIDGEGRLNDKEYWDLIYSPEEEDKGVDYYIENLRELIKNAVSRRLIADVPIGFYVSGGLDSSVVACYIGKFLLNSYYSFSAEIGSGDLNEKEFQRMVSECVKSEHYNVEVAEEEIWDNFASVIYHAESGVKESYDNAAFLLSKLVSESPAKAVLTGQGADEYFYGYVGYMVDAFRNMQKGKMTPEECAINERLWGDPYFRFERDHDAIGKIHEKLYNKDVYAEYESFSAISESPIDVNKVKDLSTMKRRSYIDNKLRLSDHLLGEHGDRMFFSHSVEGRHPFLDREVIDFVKTIPDKYKLRGVNEKYILKRAGEGIVPEPILKRKKFPFQAPGMSAMIKKKPSGPAFDDRLVKEQGVFDYAFVQELKEKYNDPEFVLMGAYEIDYLLIVMTVTMLCEQYKLTV